MIVNRSAETLEINLRSTQKCYFPSFQQSYELTILGRDLECHGYHVLGNNPMASIINENWVTLVDVVVLVECFECRDYACTGGSLICDEENLVLRHL